MALLLSHKPVVHKPAEGQRNPAPGDRGTATASEIPTGVTINPSDMVQVEELIPLLPARAVAIWGGQTLHFPAN